ncbi:MAG: oxidoreductase [Chloroflexi bacterium]|nr:oxidoreductase [Chloroflexota bacterium]
MEKWTAESIPDQSGRVAIVTGANSGLGYHTALELARKNATVVMACRNLNKGRGALDDLKQELPDAQVELMKLDLADLRSVHEFADKFRASYDRLDLLINNAGIMAIGRQETADGFEMQFGINHLGHFALTGLVIDMLTSTPNSRVITVSSGAHRGGEINFDDLMHEKDYSRWGAYSQTKLANVLFAFELNRRLRAAGASTISVAAHPGYAATNLQSIDDWAVVKVILKVTNAVMAQSAEKGALPQLYAAAAPDVSGGDFYGPHFMQMRGYPVKEQASEAAYDVAAAEKLWDVSEKLTGVSYKIGAAAVA